MEPYRVDLSAILHINGGEIHVADSLPSEPLVIGDETFTFNGPVRFDVTLTNTGAGVVAAGTVKAEVTAECSRCLEPFVMPLCGVV